MPVELAKLSFWKNQKFLRKKEKSLISRKRRGVHSFYQKVISSAVINSTIVPYQSNPWQYSFQDFRKELPLPSEEIHSLDETLSQSTQRLRQDTLINMLASKPKLITNYLEIILTLPLDLKALYLLWFYIQVGRPILSIINWQVQSGKLPSWHEMSLRDLNQTSIERDSWETSQKHLKKRCFL